MAIYFNSRPYRGLWKLKVWKKTQSIRGNKFFLWWKLCGKKNCDICHQKSDNYNLIISIKSRISFPMFKHEKWAQDSDIKGWLFNNPSVYLPPRAGSVSFRFVSYVFICSCRHYLLSFPSSPFERACRATVFLVLIGAQATCKVLRLNNALTMQSSDSWNARGKYSLRRIRRCPAPFCPVAFVIKVDAFFLVLSFAIFPLTSREKPGFSEESSIIYVIGRICIS